MTAVAAQDVKTTVPPAKMTHSSRSLGKEASMPLKNSLEEWLAAFQGVSGVSSDTPDGPRPDAAPGAVHAIGSFGNPSPEPVVPVLDGSVNPSPADSATLSNVLSSTPMSMTSAAGSPDAGLVSERASRGLRLEPSHESFTTHGLVSGAVSRSPGSTHDAKVRSPTEEEGAAAVDKSATLFAMQSDARKSRLGRDEQAGEVERGLLAHPGKDKLHPESVRPGAGLVREPVASFLVEALRPEREEAKGATPPHTMGGPMADPGSLAAGPLHEGLPVAWGQGRELTEALSGEASVHADREVPADMTYWSEAGQHQVELRVDMTAHQESRGLHVQMQLSDQVTDVRFQSESGEVRQALEQTAPQLKAQLEQAGLSLGNVSVGAEAGHMNSSGQRRSDATDSRTRQLKLASVTHAEGASVLPAKGAWATPHKRAGGIDAYV